MNPIFGTWLVINAAVVTIIAILSITTTDEDAQLNFLTYPAINTFLNEHEINVAGKTIVFVLFTIAFLPAMLLYYAVLLLMLIGAVIVMCFCKLFRRS